MVINKETWHYNLFALSYPFKEGPPETTNICQYVRRSILGGIPMLVLAAIAVVVYAFLSAGKLVLCFILDDGRPRSWRRLKDYQIDTGYVPYEGIRIGRMHFSHRWLTIPLTIAAGYLVLRISAGAHNANAAFAVLGASVAVLAAITALVVAGLAYHKSETRRLLSAWVESKTQGFCAKIEFVGKPENPSDDEYGGS